ncbi:aspartate 4-decarboxylase [Roseibium hamelinense]|uniref:Aminotransferase n=1 Tax=Roseibium hamelinense TaxID=150831 RepID=A0A562T1D3_9HYPH|nr:bifunctional aspartate transaminase/aspartate 4-decarboxylase [Roseibium hamelinense]MTI44491.1 bifunctional aspartate transaminase/aspartate 4-decarboxylase [Roseibium hamelinense]TWI87459.1 aspartate 4-decarboxylase [Roseibium hamelinense]
MPEQDYSKFAELSPFELKDKLIEIASTDAARMMLNAGRGNPNFLASQPRHAFFRLGEFSLEETERSYSYLDSGFGGLPDRNGILQRFEDYVHRNSASEGIRFLNAAISYANDQLGIDRTELVFELFQGILGCNYPFPPRMLPQAERVVSAYLSEEMFGDRPRSGPFSVFATEGGTAAMTYIFQTMKANGLIKEGDKVALGTPIFSPYLEIPPLPEYDLGIVDIRMAEGDDWQFSDAELAKLEDPAIKLFCLVNPSNPPSVKLAPNDLDRIAALVEHKRPDLYIVTDDVYGTFADDFESLFAVCPRNTLCVYSFSKYFGATGWRLGTIALHEESVFDDALDSLSEDTKQILDKRYSSLTTNPRGIRFIDRLVADSRAVALNHTAGLSTPQQVQMTLFAFAGLLDRRDAYKDAAKTLIRKRFKTLYMNMGIVPHRELNDVNYYTLINLQHLSGQLYGDAFSEWFVAQKKGYDFLFRLAKETGTVLLPGKGFEVVDASARVSLANLTEAEYAEIGSFTRQVLSEYFSEFQGIR